MISIIIPTYEQRGHGPMMLFKLLQSISIQRFKKEYEIVITDNSKDDKIKKMLETYYIKKLPIRYILNREHVGHCENFNVALDEAQGELIKPMCMDDLFMLPSALQEFYDALLLSPWVISNSLHIEHHGRVKYRKQVQYKPNEFEKNYTGMPSVVGWRKNDLRFDVLLRTYCDLWFYRQLYDMYGDPLILRNFNVGQRFWNHSASSTLPSSHAKDRLIIKERLKL